MKRKLWVVMLVTLCGILTACGQDGRYQITVITDGDHTLSGTTFGDLIIFGGKTTLNPDAVLEGSAHLLVGQFHVNGEIRGDVSLMGGELTLGQQANIDGDINVGGGQLTGLTQANVTGKINTGSGMHVPTQAVTQPKSLARTMLRWLISAAVIGLAAAVLERYLPQQISKISEAALQHLPVSLALGTLAGIVGLSLLVLLAYTILLIPVALLGLVTLGLSVVYGWIACGITLGRWAKTRLKAKTSTGWTAFVGTLVFIILINTLTAIPVIGGVFGIVIAATGLGAVFLTRFGLHRFIPETSVDPST